MLIRSVLCREQSGTRDMIIFSEIESLVCMMEAISATIGPVSDEELAHVAGGSEKRRREFAAGRTLARAALEKMGVVCDSLIATELRYPMWPNGYAGSISHNDERVAVAVVPTKKYRGVGIDLEACGSVGSNLYETVLTQREQAEVMSTGDWNLATVKFCCKEAVFKAVYPTYNEFIDFMDVEIRVKGDSFSAVGVQGTASANAIDSGVGRTRCIDSTVVSLFLI